MCSRESPAVGLLLRNVREIEPPREGSPVMRAPSMACALPSLGTTRASTPSSYCGIAAPEVQARPAIDLPGIPARSPYCESSFIDCRSTTDWSSPLGKCVAGCGLLVVHMCCTSSRNGDRRWVSVGFGFFPVAEGVAVDCAGNFSKKRDRCCSRTACCMLSLPAGRTSPRCAAICCGARKGRDIAALRDSFCGISGCTR